MRPGHGRADNLAALDARRRPAGRAPTAAGGRAPGGRSAAGAAVWRAARGQASVLLVGGLAGLLVAALIVGAVARAVGREAGAQRAADLAALAGARVMHANYGRLFVPATIRRQPNPQHLEKAAYLALGRAAAERVAEANGSGCTFMPATRTGRRR
jgi:hypothetical protein